MLRRFVNASERKIGKKLIISEKVDISKYFPPRINKMGWVVF
jgi:hypothetical protein